MAGVDGRAGGGGGAAAASGALTAFAVAPQHGPVVRTSLARLVRDYDAWAAAQVEALSASSVAVMYASAYGNTAALAQAISRGVTKGGVAVNTVNLEVATLDEVVGAVKQADGFVIGSPTLGGHMPTQVQLAIGSVLREPATRQLPCGVFGSFGWSGEAVDEMEAKLKDGGYGFAFNSIRVKFKPSPKVRAGARVYVHVRSCDRRCGSVWRTGGGSEPRARRSARADRGGAGRGRGGLGRFCRAE
jgi:flavorubredoxin